jgi:hypothetical protein
MREDADILDELLGDDHESSLPATTRTGRPVGRRESKRSQLTKRLVEEALERGESPLHILLENLSWFRSKAWQLEAELREAPTNPTIHEQAKLNRRFKALLAVRKLATDVAAAAAPYCHPRLNSISVESEAGREPITILVTDDESRL